VSGPTVAVVVANRNRSADLRRCLDAVLACGWPALEVLVVDGATTTAAAAGASPHAGVKFLKSQESAGGAAADVNVLGETTADYVALVGNDVLLEPAWIEKLVAFLEAHPDAAAAGGKQYVWDEDHPAFDRTSPWLAYTLVDPTSGLPRPVPGGADDPREVASLSGAALVRRSAIERVGAPFLEPLLFGHHGETDFFARAVRKGLRLYYTGEPACWCRPRVSTTADRRRDLALLYRSGALFAYRNLDDVSLARAVADGRKAAWRARLSSPLAALGLPGADEARARGEAHAWVVENDATLREHRQRVFDGGPGYLELSREIESRALYYGHPREDVCALVPDDARRVLDVGCGAGGLGRSLKAARPGIEVRGVEPVADQAARARRILDDVHVGGAESALPAGWPRPDCIVFADVLEHLIDPWAAVRRARELLAPGGALVVSIPNVRHHSVIADLLRGRFDYRDAGVLDRTHLRFFTGATARELVERGGFTIERTERVVEAPAGLPRGLSRIAQRTRVDDGRGPRSALADACTVQYLLRAR
jgi:GT2 family glycosyltransferase/2-polyprenyl-3-methyl-5-hydroxy-6-metoxy-1,4-benzoquinol methylase